MKMSDASILFILVLASGGSFTDALHILISKGIFRLKQMIYLLFLVVLTSAKKSDKEKEVTNILLRVLQESFYSFIFDRNSSFNEVEKLLELKQRNSTFATTRTEQKWGNHFW